MRIKIIGSLITALSITALAAAGCSSSDDTTATPSPDGGNGADPNGEGGNGAGGSPNGTGGSPPVGEITTAECLAEAEAQGEDTSDPTCGAGCFCEHCPQELGECDEDPDCVAIRECAQATNCIGIGCYQPGTCQQIIDDVGGPFGPGTALAQALSDCGEDNSCASTCGAPPPPPEDAGPGEEEDAGADANGDTEEDGGADANGDTEEDGGGDAGDAG